MRLNEQLDFGQRTENESPEKALDSDELLRAHKLSNFRAHYHTLWKVMGLI